MQTFDTLVVNRSLATVRYYVTRANQWALDLPWSALTG
jgi:hypothetical protein